MSLRKTAKKDAPHATFEFQGWTWRVLKTYKAPKSEQADQYARWFCFVTSPLCPEGEYGDTYVRDVIWPVAQTRIARSRLTQATDEFHALYAAALTA